jgi:hypothetical protein
MSRLENEYERHGNNISFAKVLASNSLNSKFEMVTELNFNSTKSERDNR